MLEHEIPRGDTELLGPKEPSEIPPSLQRSIEQKYGREGLEVIHQSRAEAGGFLARTVFSRWRALGEFYSWITHPDNADFRRKIGVITGQFATRMSIPIPVIDRAAGWGVRKFLMREFNLTENDLKVREPPSQNLARWAAEKGLKRVSGFVFKEGAEAATVVADGGIAIYEAIKDLKELGELDERVGKTIAMLKEIVKPGGGSSAEQ